MKEYNNRDIANKFAEYITGEELRKYVANKVKKYCGENISVFDGAAGSGQLEQFVSHKNICAVEIQSKPCEMLKENFENIEINNMSFFEYQDINKFNKFDAVIMNPPFSIKFKDLSDIEKTNIQSEYGWKKSGCVDDIFMLKSLDYSSRFAFYIMFPGIAYRKTETNMREIIGNRLMELNVIENGFKDTKIRVLFLVIDKQKKDNTVYKEIYDCNTKKILFTENDKLQNDYYWEVPVEPKKKEVIDIDSINSELENITLNHLKNHLDSQMILIRDLGADLNLNNFISKAYDILYEYELMLNFGIY